MNKSRYHPICNWCLAFLIHLLVKIMYFLLLVGLRSLYTLVSESLANLEYLQVRLLSDYTFFLSSNGKCGESLNLFFISTLACNCGCFGVHWLQDDPWLLWCVIMIFFFFFLSLSDNEEESRLAFELPSLIPLLLLYRLPCLHWSFSWICSNFPWCWGGFESNQRLWLEMNNPLSLSF